MNGEIADIETAIHGIAVIVSLTSGRRLNLQDVLDLLDTIDTGHPYTDSPGLSESNAAFSGRRSTYLNFERLARNYLGGAFFGPTTKEHGQTKVNRNASTRNAKTDCTKRIRRTSSIARGSKLIEDLVIPTLTTDEQLHVVSMFVFSTNDTGEHFNSRNLSERLGG
jgi:hypothetical protein